MKHAKIIPLIAGALVVLFLLAAAYILTLPYLFLGGSADASSGGRSLRTYSDVYDFQVLKVVHGFSRYHPLHQVISQDFAVPLEKAADLRLIVEVYPENITGSAEQVLKGVVKGSIEICLAESGMVDALQDGGDVFGSAGTSGVSRVRILTRIKGPERHIWKLKTSAPEDERRIALKGAGREERNRLRALGFNPVVESPDILFLNARDGRFDYVELDLIEWYYQGWGQWTAGRYSSDFDVPEYLLIRNTSVYNNLDSDLRELVYRYAEQLSKRAAESIQESEKEILAYSGLNTE